MISASLLFTFQILQVFILNSRILPPFDTHFVLTCAKTFFFVYFKMHPSNFLRVPPNFPLCIACISLLVLQFFVYHLQMRLGPRLKPLDLNASDLGYRYFKKGEIFSEREDQSCPICFDELCDHVSFDSTSTSDQLEQVSLLVDYLGRR